MKHTDLRIINNILFKIQFSYQKAIIFKLTTARRRFRSQNLISREIRITLDTPIYNDSSSRSFDNPTRYRWRNRKLQTLSIQCQCHEIARDLRYGTRSIWYV